jgi:spoIIIJ-associated protein
MSGKDSSKTAKRELETLLGLMGFEATVEVFEQGDEEILLHIEADEAARLIGRGAQVLDALQYLLNRALYKQDAEALHCIVDIERYRERKKDRLLKDAYDAAEKVKRDGRPVKFAPMGAADRRTIHQALKDDPEVETVSDQADDSGKKRLIVRMKKHSREDTPGQEPEAVPEDIDGNVDPETPAADEE